MHNTTTFSRALLLTLSLLLALQYCPAQHGSVVWHVKAKGPIVGSPVIYQGLVFVGGLDSTLYAFNLSTGQEAWKVSVGGSIRTTPVIANQKLFLNADNGKLYCLDPQKGNMLWLFSSFNGYMGDGSIDFADYYASSPIIQQQTIYFGSGNQFYAVDAETGKLIWWFKAEGAIHTKPAIDDNRVYFGSFGGYVYALDANTGNKLWEFKTTGHSYFPKGEVSGNPVVVDGKVLVGARDYHLYALDAHAGYCHWLKQFPKGWALPITVDDSLAYVGTSDDRSLLALIPDTGDELWRLNTAFNVFGGCVVANGFGYVGTLAGKLICFAVAHGDTQWEFETEARKLHHAQFLVEGDAYRTDIGNILKSSSDVLRMYKALGAVFSTPALHDGKLVISCYDGSIYCLQL